MKDFLYPYTNKYMDNSTEQKLIQKKYDELSIADQKLVHQLYHKQESDRTQEYDALRKLVFKIEPPTPEQFLDPVYGWLPKNFTDSLYDHIKEDFIEICNPEKKYKQIVEYGATRLGKTYLSRLIIMYIIVWCHCLRHPQLYYGLAPTTVLSIYLMCWKEEKTRQLLLKPLYDLFSLSERFKRIHLQDKVHEEQDKIGNDIIVWSKAATFGSLTLASNTTINLGTDFMSFLGADLLFLSVSEILFFVNKAGATVDEIFQIYSDGLARIKATVGNNFLGMVLLDSSANDSSNSIEKYILNDLQFQKNVFFRRRNQWEARPYLFPTWQKTNETFSVFTGNSSSSSQIINIGEENKFPKNLIIQVPIDAKDEFERNITKSIKDIAGIPQENEQKFITSGLLIDNLFNDNSLKNIDSILYASAEQQPEKLLFNQIKNIFFIKNQINDKEKYVIYRAPKEPRYFGLDLSFSVKGDLQGLCMLHKEHSLKKEGSIYVIDFCFAIGSKDTAISLEAPFNLIFDLNMYAEIPIRGVFVDSFQSQQSIQLLERNGISAIKQSIDMGLNPYLYLLTCLNNETLKIGKNIFLKNNLDSLIHTKRNEKEKIDHIKGKTNNVYSGNWDTSDCGINAKDVSDALCQAVWGAYNDAYIPSTIYEEENKRFSGNKEVISKNISSAWSSLHGSRIITNN